MSSYKKILFTLLFVGLALSALLMLRKGTPDRVSATQQLPAGLHNIEDARLHELKNIVPIAVIGAGPAGLSAALYGARAGTHTVVFAGPTPGGQLTGTSDIENWPGVPKSQGVAVMNTLKEQAQTFGAQYILDTVTSADLSSWPFKLRTADGELVHALSIIIATGARPRLLNVEGELRYWGKGVTTCAVCDAPYYKDGDVMVIGGGDSAAEEAMQLAPYARSITVLVRSSAMRASAIMQDRLKQYPNITIQYHKEVKKILGDDQHVTAVEILDTATGQLSTLPIDGVFLAIGHVPNTQMFVSQLELDDQSLIKTLCPTQQTSVKGVFAAGEVIDGRYRQAGVAAGDGIKAALDALEFLRSIGLTEQQSDELAPQFFNITKGPKAPPLAKITSEQELEQNVLNAKGIVVLDFYADYCPSCLAMMPAMQEIAQEFSAEAAFYKLDAGVCQDICKRLFVTSLPTVLIFKDGTLIARYNKAMNKQELRDMVQALLA